MKKLIMTLAMLSTLLLPATAASASTKLPTVTIPGTPKTVVLTAKGDGPVNTRQFVVPSSVPYWQVNWSYNCHPSGSTGNFNFAVNTPIGSDSNDYDTPNQLGWAGASAQRYTDHGTFWLEVQTEQGCVWSVQVITGPSSAVSLTFDQAWTGLTYNNPTSNGIAVPVQVRVTIHNDGPTVVAPGTIDYQLMYGKTVWATTPTDNPTLYQCSPSLSLKLVYTTIPAGGSLSGCLVFQIPRTVITGQLKVQFAHGHGITRLAWIMDGKTHYVPISHSLPFSAEI
jgi:hypothetical protein